MLHENFLVNYKALGVFKNIRCHCKRFEVFTKKQKEKISKALFSIIILFTGIFLFLCFKHIIGSTIRHFTYMVNKNKLHGLGTEKKEKKKVGLAVYPNVGSAGDV